MSHPAFHLKFGKPVADLDDYVSRLLADEHDQHRTPHALCPRCSPGVRTWREVVPPRERRPEPASIKPGKKAKSGPQPKPFGWLEEVRSAGGEWVPVKTMGSWSSATVTASDWRKRLPSGYEVRACKGTISARWREA